jgi:hypothetical protein
MKLYIVVVVSIFLGGSDLYSMNHLHRTARSFNFKNMGKFRRNFCTPTPEKKVSMLEGEKKTLTQIAELEENVVQARLKRRLLLKVAVKSAMGAMVGFEFGRILYRRLEQ